MALDGDGGDGRSENARPSRVRDTVDFRGPARNTGESPENRATAGDGGGRGEWSTDDSRDGGGGADDGAGGRGGSA